MLYVEQLVEGLEMRQFAGTADGVALLEQNEQLQHTIIDFARHGDAALLDQDHFEPLGKGEFSVVAGLGDLAVKVSTPATNTHTGDRLVSGEADRLVDQFHFMTALGVHLDKNALTHVKVPRQYFSLATKAGNTMLVQQRLYGVEKLGEWHDKYGDDPHEVYDTFAHIQDRITMAVGVENPLYDGLNDLGLRDLGRPSLHNILVPANTPQVHSGPVFVIDQPSSSRYGALAARRARINLRNETQGKTRPLIRNYAA